MALVGISKRQYAVAGGGDCRFAERRRAVDFIERSHDALAGSNLANT